MYKRLLIFFLTIFSILQIVFFAFSPALAYDFEVNSGVGATGRGAGYEDANLTDESFAEVVGKVIRVLLSFLGVFFLLLMIYAGFIWMFSRGNSSEVEKSKKIMQNALIGLIVVLMAYGITALVMTAFVNPPTS